MRRGCFILVILLVGVGGLGCLSRKRLNVNCEWTEPGPQALDLQNAAHQQHLSEDVDTAIEIVVRSADAEHGRRTGFSSHGGYVDFGRFREVCREKVLAGIAEAHNLTLEEVRNTRVRRDWRFVSATAISFVALYCLGSMILCRMLAGRFSEDEFRPKLMAFTMASLAASAAGVHLAVMWFTTAESIRVGNDHLSGLRRVAPSSALLVAMFLAGVVLFWLAGLRQYARRVPTPPSASIRPLHLNA